MIFHLFKKLKLLLLSINLKHVNKFKIFLKKNTVYHYFKEYVVIKKLKKDFYSKVNN